MKWWLILTLFDSAAPAPVNGVLSEPRYIVREWRASTFKTCSKALETMELRLNEQYMLRPVELEGITYTLTCEER